MRLSFIDVITLYNHNSPQHTEKAVALAHLIGGAIHFVHTGREHTLLPEAQAVPGNHASTHRLVTNGAHHFAWLAADNRARGLSRCPTHRGVPRYIERFQGPRQGGTKHPHWHLVINTAGGTPQQPNCSCCSRGPKAHSEEPQKGRHPKRRTGAHSTSAPPLLY